MPDFKATDLPVRRFFHDQPKSCDATDAQEVAGAALIRKAQGRPWEVHSARRTAQKQFNATVAHHPERAYFVAETCELAGARSLATQFYQKATQHPLTAAHAWHRLGLMREQQANLGLGAWFARRNSQARAAFGRAALLNVADSNVERFESWTDRFTQTWLGVSCYDHLHGKHNHHHLPHPWDRMAFQQATTTFATALPLRPEEVLAQMDVLLQSPLGAREPARVTHQVLVPLRDFLRSDAVKTSETPWILASRSLLLVSHCANCPDLYPMLQAVLDAMQASPLGAGRYDGAALERLRNQLTLTPPER